MNIEKKSSYHFKNHISWQIEPVTETVYIFDNKNGTSYFFENIGKDIWKMIDSKITVKDMIDLLSSRYEVSKVQLEEDIISFIDEIIGEDLIYEL